MSKKYKAVVENGAIHIETPEFENGTLVSIMIEKNSTSKSENCFEIAAKMYLNEFPDDFSITHKEASAE